MTSIRTQGSGSEFEKAALLTGITDELGQWSLDIAAYPIDDIPHLIATIDRWGSRAITAVEIAQRCDATEHKRTQTQNQRFVLRANTSSAREAQPIICAMPLIAARPGQPIIYEVAVVGDNKELARLSGAFSIAQGQLVLC